ncbi:MAG: PD40 domain-containing protein, partial [Ignavibacteriales bacterium]|nr:PD40 domain-containing protein [Ignavibacteriales bacterium]
MHINPRWSPDGSKIVFQNMERTKLDLKVVDIHSGKMTWVTNDLFRDISPVWSPSGKEIYFSSDRGGGLNIWRIPISADGARSGQPEQLTTGAGQDVDIAISPDGKRLAYSVLKLNADIWKLPVSSDSGKALGEPQQVIATTREDSRGAWSPDGTMIAFNSDRTGDMNIWVYFLRDGSARQLTKGSGGDFQPNWSPDAKQIVFFSSRSGNADIWTIEVSSGELKQLTQNSSLEINPFYSPDGDYIAFQSDATGRLEPWVMNNDGTNQRSIANMEVSGHFMRWSREGTSLIFRSPNPSQPGLWTASMNGGEPAFLVVPKGGAHTSLSPRFDFVMDVVGHKEMWVTPLTGRVPEKVFEFSDPEI